MRNENESAISRHVTEKPSIISDSKNLKVSRKKKKSQSTKKDINFVVLLDFALLHFAVNN